MPKLRSGRPRRRTPPGPGSRARPAAVGPPDPELVGNGLPLRRSPPRAASRTRPVLRVEELEDALAGRHEALCSTPNRSNVWADHHSTLVRMSSSNAPIRPAPQRRRAARARRARLFRLLASVTSAMMLTRRCGWPSARAVTRPRPDSQTWFRRAGRPGTPPENESCSSASSVVLRQVPVLGCSAATYSSSAADLAATVEEVEAEQRHPFLRPDPGHLGSRSPTSPCGRPSAPTGSSPRSRARRSRRGRGSSGRVSTAGSIMRAGRGSESAASSTRHRPRVRFPLLPLWESPRGARSRLMGIGPRRREFRQRFPRLHVP